MFNRNLERDMRIRVIIWAVAMLLGVFYAHGAKTDKPFTIVIDAGHGGRDPGAMGKLVREKDVNLAIALRLGERIEKGMSNTRVLYTRKTDVFLPLQDRANFVNENSADLFICIHTNAAENTSVHGVETFTLGLNKLESNLDVAMRENSVILLEDNYEANYQGFDPSSVESYIMFEFMQDQYIDKSLSFATLAQKSMSGKCKRNNRGVRQAAFWVLHKSACPSVLIEVGFLSNQQEEKFLASDSGRDAMAGALYDAVVEYKKDIDKKNGVAYVTANKTEPALNTSSETSGKTKGLVYKIQIAAVKKELNSKDPALKGLKNVKYYREGGFYKYTYGEENDFESIEQLRKSIRSKFPEAFVIAFKDGKKISVTEARALER